MPESTNNVTKAFNHKAIKAIKKYNEAQLMLGPADKGKKRTKIREGIAVFSSIQEAIEDANANIALYTKSDFSSAWFYEAVLIQAKAMLEEQL